MAKRETLAMENGVCSTCDGRGFHWQKGMILNRDTGKEVATTYKQGPFCQTCNGLGYVKSFSWLSVLGMFCFAAPLAYALFYFLLSV